MTGLTMQQWHFQLLIHKHWQMSQWYKRSAAL